MSSSLQRSARLLVASVATTVLASPAVIVTSAHAETAVASSTKAWPGVIPFSAADVTHIGGTDWTVSWTAPADITSVRVFVGTSTTAFPAAAAATSTRPAGAVTISSATRPWVKLVGSYGAPLVISSRSLGLASAANLREAGGYRTSTGQWVRHGALLRSQALTISSAEQPTVDALGIATDYDLRTTCEAKQAPDVVPAGATRVHLNVVGDDGVDTENCPASSLPSGITTPADAAAMMTQGEVGLVDSAPAKKAYHGLYAGLLADRGVSIFHCTAGKDRTGWASAALLTLLGVPADTVMEDYLLSNRYYYATAGQATVDQLNGRHPGAGDVVAPMLQVRAEYLQAGLDRVAQEYGSMQAYFEKGLGFSSAELDALRAKLLVGAPLPTPTAPTAPAPTAPAPNVPKTLSVAKPTITGRARVGGRLSGHVARPAGATVSYQWMANGKRIARATTARLKLTRALEGKRVSLRVTVTSTGYRSASATSRAVRVRG